MVPPQHTDSPAPERGGPVACLSGPVRRPKVRMPKVRTHLVIPEVEGPKRGL